MMRVQRPILTTLCLILATAALGVSLICLLNGHQALFYFIDIFTLPILMGVGLQTVCFFLIGQKSAGSLTALAVAILALSVMPQAFPQQGRPDATARPVRILFANLWIRNPTPAHILPWIEQENPDIIAFVEANPYTRDGLMTAITASRPYVYARYDTVIVSRWPLSDGHPIHYGFALNRVTVQAPQGAFELDVVHLYRPWPYTDPGTQPAQFAKLAEALSPVDQKRRVLVGDFNTPPLASAMHDFTRVTRLHTAPALWGTWNSRLPGALRINIDNAFASPGLVFTRRRGGPFNGSDHRPIVVDIQPGR